MSWINGFRKRFSYLLILVCLICSTASAENTAKESTELADIVVTAQKQKENLGDIPANITVVSGDMMEDLSINNIDELTELSPNINVDKIDSHMTQVVFRGIGGTTNMNKIWNTNIDGVTIPYVGMDMFLDVERVELMRGSQGSLYGRNTHAGVVNVITKKPGDNFSSDFSIELENYNTKKVKAAFGGPAGEKQGYRFAFGYNKTDGYIDNEFLDIEDGNDHEQFSGRAIYDYKVSDDSLLRFSLIGDKYEGGFDTFALASKGATHKTANSEVGENKGHLVSPTMTFEKNFSNMTLTSVTNYSNSNFHTLFDQDSSPYDMFLMEYDEDFATFMQELRLTGKTENVQWLTGLFLMMEDMDSSTDFSFGKDAPPMKGFSPAGMHMFGDGSIDSRGAAFFCQFIIKPADKLELRTRLRLDYEKRELSWKGKVKMGGMQMSAQDYSRDDVWVGFMPSVSLSYIFDDNHRIYTSVDRGYKVGDYAANQVDLQAVQEPVDPEYTLTYELGYKGFFADKRIFLSAAAFYIDWTDMQVSALKDNSSVALMQNAAEAHSYGIELETRFKVTHGFDIFAGLGWLEGEFDKYDNHPSGENFSGKDLPNANRFSASLGGTYRHTNGLFASVSGSWMGPKYMDEQNIVEQKSYFLLNSKIGYESDSWGAYLYGRNLLDEEYLVHTFANAGRSGEPKIFGCQLNYYF